MWVQDSLEVLQGLGGDVSSSPLTIVSLFLSTLNLTAIEDRRMTQSRPSLKENLLTGSRKKIMITNRTQEKEIPQVPSGALKGVCLQWFYPHQLLCLSSR